jgi:hypothetical protein
VGGGETGAGMMVGGAVVGRWMVVGGGEVVQYLCCYGILARVQGSNADEISVLIFCNHALVLLRSSMRAQEQS